MKDANSFVRPDYFANIREPRGLQTSIHTSDFTNDLNILAKIFCTDGAEYTSVILPHYDNAPIYISHPEGWGESNKDEKRITLNKDEIAELTKRFKKVLNDTSDDNKASLLREAYRDHNPFVDKVITKKKQGFKKEYTNSYEKQLNKLNMDSDEEYKKIHNIKNEKEYSKAKAALNEKCNTEETRIKKSYEDSLRGLKDTEIINQYVAELFDKFLSNEELDNLDQFKDSDFAKVPEMKECVRSVHVEAQGVYYVSLLHKDIRDFSIGLAKKDTNPDIGCCSGCQLEFTLLAERDNDPVKVYRSSDFIENMPPGTYKPSPLIPDDQRHLFEKVEVFKGLYRVPMHQNQKREEEHESVLEKQEQQFEKQKNQLEEELEKARQEVEDLEKEKESLKVKLQEQEQQFEKQKNQLEEEHKLKLEEQQLKHKQQLELQEKLEKLKEEHKAKSKEQVQQLKEQLVLELQKKQEKLKKEHEEVSQEQVQQLKEQFGLELQEKLKDGNHHLKQVDKWMLSQDEDGQSYSLHDSLVAANSNPALLGKLEIESVITADIDLKAIDVKKDMAGNKAVRVEFLAEYHHESDHGRNIQSLIEGIESGGIGEDTVIAIERKSYGKNLGMPDVVLLASIIEHNGRNPDNQLQIPEGIIKDSLIYHDALLYKTAKEHGVKIVGVEGRNLQADKSSPGGYDQAREEYMADGINQLTCKGYNVIVHVGAAHVDSLRKLLESFAEIDTPESSRWDGVLSEVAGIGFVDEDAENFDGIGFSSCACEYSPQEIELTGDYTS